MRLLITSGLVLALAACGGTEEVVNNTAVPKPAPTPGPRLGGVPLDEPVRAASERPGWEIYLAPGMITYADAPDAVPADFYPVSPALQADTATYATQTIDGEPVTITLTDRSCTAGDQQLPLTAEARIGGRTLNGCAGPAERRRSSPAEPPVEEGTNAP